MQFEIRSIARKMSGLKQGELSAETGSLGEARMRFCAELQFLGIFCYLNKGTVILVNFL